MILILGKIIPPLKIITVLLIIDRITKILIVKELIAKVHIAQCIILIIPRRIIRVRGISLRVPLIRNNTLSITPVLVLLVICGSTARVHLVARPHIAQPERADVVEDRLDVALPILVECAGTKEVHGARVVGEIDVFDV